MARKKTITRDQILDAAYNVVAKSGFTRFTARNIAAEMNCSTQPIYLEFKNMEDLKNEVIKKIRSYIKTKIYPVVRTGNRPTDLALNYINFARDEKSLYRALYLEEYGGGKDVQVDAYNYFYTEMRNEPQFVDVSDEVFHSLHTSIWIEATGIASLMSSGIINPSEEQIIQLINISIETVLKRENPVVIDY